MKKSGNQIRQMFLDFFKEQGHSVVESSGLIPKDDPTLLFTNSGMVQFKDCFLGLENRGYTRAASSQKCVRAGGKHNDLENVGYTARHHTFFEMLGNFSFGDYFKRESIRWGWEFLTEKVCLPKEKLWITIYDDDDEAFNIWHKEIGVDANRIVRMGAESNFWMMGDTGPCGPCSEILFDQGADVGCGRPDCSVHCDCDRHLEIWNHVFTQYNRSADGTLTPLPKPNIDTGMGLERLAAVVQGVKNNYDTDIFAPIISFIAKISDKQYSVEADIDASIRVIADHARAITFLIADGVMPSNEGRGYTLRRILRRAARHGKLLGMNKPFLHEVVSSVVDSMKDAYPDIFTKEAFVKKIVFNEERRFIETLDGGLKILNEEVAQLRKTGAKVLSGAIAFKLYDSYGFPLDLTADIVRKDDVAVDVAGFEKAMEAQRQKSRKSWKGSGEEAIADSYKKLAVAGIETDFCGYCGETNAHSVISAIIKNGVEVSSLGEGEQGEIFVNQTPFYGEKGGQVGDIGHIENDNTLFVVSDTQEPFDKIIAHIGIVQSGSLHVGDEVSLKVNADTRHAIEAHHSATHLLNAALIAVLGDHVKQSGSLVTSERLRFDFTHFSKIEEEQLLMIEELANRYIQANKEVVTLVAPKEEAMQMGACAVFGEKYADVVRVVGMGNFSQELCGGTHVSKTGDIGIVKISSESSVAAGVRRIEAIAGIEALKFIQKTEAQLKQVSLLLKSTPADVAERVEKLLQQQRDLERERDTLKSNLALKDSADLLSQIKEINGVKLLATVVHIDDVKTLRDFGDKLRDKIQSGVIFLASVADSKVMLLCLVTKDLTNHYHAGNIIKEVAPLVGGSGGGRADMAQAGGTNVSGVQTLLQKVAELL
ncbi:MAG: alanine--tRNA ligase [Deltaproteobacteria bacterium]